MIVILCPGQGSQKPGFLEPWLALPGAAERIEAASAASGVDLLRHGTVSNEATIRDTAVAQPLIVAAGLLTLAALAERAPLDGVGVAGHSVGEITAAVAAGVLSEDDAMRFVTARAGAMAEAAAATPTGMSAVVGGDEGEVVALIEELGLTPANRNGGGQIVAAGEPVSLDALAERAPRGVRVVPLSVAGAFHSPFMAPAREALAGPRAALSPSDPVRPLWTNSTGSRVSSGAAFADALVSQVASPVRWDLTMASFQDEGVTGVIELAPAGALVGLAKRGLRGTPAVAVRGPEDLDAAADLIGGAA